MSSIDYELYSNKHFKVHFPYCGCRYNRKNHYCVDILCKITKKYTYISFNTIEELCVYLHDKPYSVCIHQNTPSHLLNGGVIFLTRSPQLYKDLLKPSPYEIESAGFIKTDDIIHTPTMFKEYDNFTPICNSAELYTLLPKNSQYWVLICRQNDGIDSYPKGKRDLFETADNCAFREFREEVGFDISDRIARQEYIRKISDINLPTSTRIFNFLFQIVIDDN